MSNKLFSKWFDKQPKETQNLVNDYIANKIKKQREDSIKRGIEIIKEAKKIREAYENT